MKVADTFIPENPYLCRYANRHGYSCGSLAVPGFIAGRV